MTIRGAFALGGLAVTLAWMGCGSDVVDGTGGGGTGGGPVDCQIDGPGAPFTFVVNNVGARELRLTYGCGTTYPISITTPSGDLGIGPGNADFCEVSCDAIYAGGSATGCSDCGPGSGAALPPGGQVTIDWDRRTYVAHTAPASCSGHPDDNTCALGEQLADGVYTATLEICTNQDGIFGDCGASDVEVVPFQIDLATATVTIDVQ